MELKNTIHHLAHQSLEEIISIRRHLHQYPELSFQEHQTVSYISTILREYNIPHQTGIAGTGIVAHIEGQNPSKKMIALRADIDALPITEKNTCPYTSSFEGVMHACGHDAHTASLLGAAKILQSIKHAFEGTIRIIFQPGEEKLPGGASLMIKEGVLENPIPKAIFGQHVTPPLEVGKVGFKAGAFMASADEIYISIYGKGGHAATPQDCIDPILISSHLIVALQQIISRNANPLSASVLSFGKIYTKGGATNIIPNEVCIEGTFRALDEKWRAEAHERMTDLANLLCKSMGATCKFDIKKGYPVLHNHEVLTENTKQKAIEYLGAESVVDLPTRMGAEDFAYYSHVIPACFYRLGTGNKKKPSTLFPLHNDQFDIDENALEIGAGLMAWLAVQ